MASLILNKRSGYYYAQFYSQARIPNRKTVSLGTRKRRIAERALSKLEDAVALGEVNPWAAPEAPVELPEGLQEAIESYLDSCSHLKASTIETYQDVLYPFMRYLGPKYKLSRITGAGIMEWLNSTKAGPVTRTKYLAHLGYFFRYLLRRGVLVSDPAATVHLKTLPKMAPKSMTPDQVGRLVDCIKSHSAKAATSHRHKDFTWLAHLIQANVHMGLRRGELIHLRWEHIDFEREILLVKNTDLFTTKTSRERAIPMCYHAVRSLRILETYRNGENVFHNSGFPIKPRTLSIIFQKFRRMAGLPDHINLHSTRHTFGTWLAERGTPVIVIQNLMGHSSLTTTERYMSTRADVAESWVKRAFDPQ